VKEITRNFGIEPGALRQSFLLAALRQRAARRSAVAKSRAASSIHLHGGRCPPPPPTAATKSKSRLTPALKRPVAKRSSTIAGVEPRLNGEDPVAFIYSANLARRDLTPGEKAILIAKGSYTNLYNSAGHSGGEISKTARVAGIPQPRISVRYAPGLADDVLAKRLRLDEAVIEARRLRALAETNAELWEKLRAEAPGLVGKRLVQAFVTLDCMPRSRGLRGPGKRRHRRGREAFLAACKLGWGRGGGGGLPVPHNEAGPAKGDECDEQRGEVEFNGRVHFKTSWLAKVIINHAGSAPDRKRRVWICLKSQGLARLGHAFGARPFFLRQWGRLMRKTAIGKGWSVKRR
jgi:hypothetical protein